MTNHRYAHFVCFYTGVLLLAATNGFAQPAPPYSQCDPKNSVFTDCNCSGTSQGQGCSAHDFTSVGGPQNSPNDGNGPDECTLPLSGGTGDCKQMEADGQTQGISDIQSYFITGANTGLLDCPGGIGSNPNALGMRPIAMSFEALSGTGSFQNMSNIPIGDRRLFKSNLLWVTYDEAGKRGINDPCMFAPYFSPQTAPSGSETLSLVGWVADMKQHQPPVISNSVIPRHYNVTDDDTGQLCYPGYPAFISKVAAPICRVLEAFPALANHPDVCYSQSECAAALSQYGY